MREAEGRFEALSNASVTGGLPHVPLLHTFAITLSRFAGGGRLAPSLVALAERLGRKGFPLPAHPRWVPERSG